MFHIVIIFKQECITPDAYQVTCYLRPRLYYSGASTHEHNPSLVVVYLTDSSVPLGEFMRVEVAV